MRSIGLTGGIASGKSTVVAMLQELGASVIDADKLGHQTYEPGSPAFTRIVAAFGDGIVAEDGTIDRRALGGKVFGDPAEMTRLTDIVWPEIRALAAAELTTLAATGVDVGVVEAAVLVEAGWQDLFDEVWVITVPPEVARGRLMERNGLSADEAEARIASQLNNAERAEHADLVIDTNCSLDEVRDTVVQAWDALTQRIAAAG